MMKVRKAVAEFLADKEPHVTYKTMYGYRQYLSHFAEWCEQNNLEMENLKRGVVRRYITELRDRPNSKDGKPLSDWYVHGHARTLRTFLRWCGQEEDLSDIISPGLGRVEMPKTEQTEVVVFSDEEIRRLLAAADRNSSVALRYRDRAIICTLLDTGIRATELVYDPKRPVRERTGLLIENVHLDPEDSYIKVFGKGRKEREVGLGPTSRKAIRSYLRFRRPVGEGRLFLFLTRSGDPLTLSGLEQLMVRLSEKAGVEDCHPHKFRHTFAVNYLMAGGDIYTLSRLLGHTTVEMTTRVYLRAVTAQQARGKGISVMERFK
jgi:site-specific recombinase XerD